jgi:hypothetical protein
VEPEAAAALVVKRTECTTTCSMLTNNIMRACLSQQHGI